MVIVDMDVYHLKILILRKLNMIA